MEESISPRFIRLLGLSKIGVSSEYCDVESCFMRLASIYLREMVDTEGGESFTAFGSYIMLMILKY